MLFRALAWVHADINWCSSAFYAVYMEHQLMLFRFNVRFARASLEPHPNERVKIACCLKIWSRGHYFVFSFAIPTEISSSQVISVRTSGFPHEISVKSKREETNASHSTPVQSELTLTILEAFPQSSRHLIVRVKEMLVESDDLGVNLKKSWIRIDFVLNNHDSFEFLNRQEGLLKFVIKRNSEGTSLRWFLVIN